MAESLVPVVSLPSSDRLREMQTMFSSRHKQSTDFIVRVPGRVNLIGEHIDYCGYGVCPMALEQDVILAVARRDDCLLKLSNLDPAYLDYECDIRNFSILVGDGKPEWHQYFLCGVRGILDVLPKDTAFKGFSVLVSGTVPPRAGLSSSSALVSAAALATATVYEFPISKEEIASLCADCERYIGTQGGGMDQAIAFLATKGCAKLIGFGPLRSKDVTLPKGAVFVIAHSLSEMNKAATSNFNCRVVECRLAAQVIAKKKGLPWITMRKLGELQEALGIDLQSMIELVESTLHREPYTKEELLSELQTTADKLEEVSLTPNTREIPTFKLYQRAIHVVREALRVQQFHSICSNPPKEGNALEQLGRLMTESHISLRDDYECSHPQLDRLVEMSKDFSYGARLTGAGWGGCAVALVPPDNVHKYISFLKENFYGSLGVHEALDSLVFATAPNDGACVYL